VKQEWWHETKSDVTYCLKCGGHMNLMKDATYIKQCHNCMTKSIVDRDVKLGTRNYEWK
jgi:Zn ribbon nucleic-acid-binding protein